jgi:hypothetical protein
VQIPNPLHNDLHLLTVIPSRREESPGEPLALMREETRSKLERSLINEFALRAGIPRGGSE